MHKEFVPLVFALVLLTTPIGTAILFSRHDRGDKFISKKWDTYMAEHRIIQECTINTPQQNTIAGCKNRTLEGVCWQK